MRGIREFKMPNDYEVESHISNVREWSDWSLTPHTEDEIRDKCLNDFNNVCFTFLCSTSKMSCDFIEELMALSTGILTEENYSEMHDKVLATVLAKNGVKDVTAEKWSIPKSKTNLMTDGDNVKDNSVHSSSVNDRLDWIAICRNQRLSEDFMRKFKDKLSWKEVALNQKMSDAFKEEFSDQLTDRIIRQKKKEDKEYN